MGKDSSCLDAYIYAGIAEHKLGNPVQAVFWFSQYPAIEKNVPPEVVEAYGISLTETKDYAEARYILNEGIKRWPEYHWLYMRLGIAEAALGNHAAAVSALRISHEYAPEDGYVLYLIIASLVELGRYEEASSFADHISLKSNTDSWVLWARWRAYTGAGMDQKGSELLLDLSEILPELHPFYQYLYVDVNPGKVRRLLEELDGTVQQVFPEVYMLLDRSEK